MRPESLTYLEDILWYAADALEISHGRSFERYIKDKEFRYAIERCFEVIGEALTKINKIDPSVAQTMTEWRKIIGFRNVLIHGYDQIDDAITWRILTEKLPALLNEARKLFMEGGGSSDDLPPI
jgi:uncharacterized protein with HEPN domain